MPDISYFFDAAPESVAFCVLVRGAITHRASLQILYFLIVVGLIVIGVTAALMFYVQTIKVLRPSGTFESRNCAEKRALRLPKAWFPGSPAGPDIEPARPVGGPSASVKGPAGGLAKLRIAHPIRVTEGLSGISTRCPGIRRCLQDQEAGKTACCTLKKDSRHCSFSLVVRGRRETTSPGFMRLLRRDRRDHQAAIDGAPA